MLPCLLLFLVLTLFNVLHVVSPTSDPYLVENGICYTSTNCTCDEGYEGDECSVWSCGGISTDDYWDNPCSNRGTCLSPDVCRCTFGSHGPTCATYLLPLYIFLFFAGGCCLCIVCGGLVACRCIPLLLPCYACYRIYKKCRDPDGSKKAAKKARHEAKMEEWRKEKAAEQQARQDQLPKGWRAPDDANSFKDRRFPPMQVPCSSYVCSETAYFHWCSGKVIPDSCGRAGGGRYPYKWCGRPVCDQETRKVLAYCEGCAQDSSGKAHTHERDCPKCSGSYWVTCETCNGMDYVYKCTKCNKITQAKKPVERRT